MIIAIMPPIAASLRHFGVLFALSQVFNRDIVSISGMNAEFRIGSTSIATRQCA